VSPDLQAPGAALGELAEGLASVAKALAQGDVIGAVGPLHRALACCTGLQDTGAVVAAADLRMLLELYGRCLDQAAQAQEELRTQLRQAGNSVRAADSYRRNSR